MPMPAASCLVEKLPDEVAACLFKHLDRTSRHNIARTSRGTHCCILKQLHTLRLFLGSREHGDPAWQLSTVPKQADINHLIVQQATHSHEVKEGSSHTNSGSLTHQLYQTKLSPFSSLMLLGLQRALLLHMLHHSVHVPVTGPQFQLQHITHLELKGVFYRIHDAEAQGLAELLAAAFPHLANLLLQCEWPPAFIHALAASPALRSSLTSLSMGPYYELDEQDSNAISRLSSLRAIALRADRVGDLSALAALKQLEELTWELGFAAYGGLGATKASEGEAEPGSDHCASLRAVLAGCTRLERLSIAHSCGLQWAPQSSSLKKLELGHQFCHVSMLPDACGVPALEQLVVHRLTLDCRSCVAAESASSAWEQLAACVPACFDTQRAHLYHVTYPGIRLLCGDNHGAAGTLGIALKVLKAHRPSFMAPCSVSSLTVTRAYIQPRDLWHLAACSDLRCVKHLSFCGCDLAGSSLLEAVQVRAVSFGASVHWGLSALGPQCLRQCSLLEAVQVFSELSLLVVCSSNIHTQEAATSVIATCFAGQSRKSGRPLRVEVAPFPPHPAISNLTLKTESGSTAGNAHPAHPAQQVEGLLKGWQAVAKGFRAPCEVEVALHIGTAEFV